MITGETGDEDSSHPVVAAFDFDGTLVHGGSVFPFLVRVRGLLPVLAAVARTAPHLLNAAVAGGAAADRSKEELFMRLLAGEPAEQVDRVARDFARRHLARRLRPEIRQRLDWHRAQGHRVVIVSASPECYVRRVGHELGVDGVVATRLEVDASGLLTGRYDGKNCRGSEKYGRVVTWLRTNGLSGIGTAQPVLWAYGNSRGDLRLLQAADHGVDAGRLGRFGRLHRFPRFDTLTGSSTGEPVG
jgi:HAD superfamily hydrolase (TIGR01490 family)